MVFVMDFTIFSQMDLYQFVLLPLLIFFARVCDVSLGTIRIIFISKGIRYLAPLVGFFEVIIWLLAIGQIMQNLSNAYYYLFYAAGFATGNYVGIIIEEKLSIGTVGIRIITKRDAKKLVDVLKEHKFSVSVVDGEGATGPIKIIFAVTPRQNISKIIKIVKANNPNAFYSIEDIRFVNETLEPYSSPIWNRKYQIFNRRFRKGK
jgi:uncharacterized protein YebE (UPF0316 family)